MAQQHKQYAEGASGELYGYTGKDAPAGTQALVEEDGKTLTPAGLKFCQKRGYPTPLVETLRVIHDQYHSPAVGQAIEASALNADLIIQKQNNTKKMSERLRLDWEAQDKAFKANAAAKK
jgi:hypothetical protein